VRIECKITLFFAAFGGAAGCLSGLMSVTMNSASYGLLLAIIFGYISFKWARQALRVTPEQLPGGDRKLATTGLWPFFITWLILWIITYSLALK